jgi:WhiB family redox-sensing transcriptional regulator
MRAVVRADLDDFLAELADVPDFFREALCVEYPELADAFFATLIETVDAAKAVCARCLVRAECLDYAMTRPETRNYGVWGGTLPQETEAPTKRTGCLSGYESEERAGKRRLGLVPLSSRAERTPT